MRPSDAQLEVRSAVPRGAPALRIGVPALGPPKIRCMVVCGTRPEIIKLYPLIRELRERPVWDVVVCHTGQHRSLADLHFRELGITPDVDLRIMRRGQTIPYVVARIVARLEPVLAAQRPQVLIVQGDTTSGMAAALCAFGMQIPVVHVEAGLRTGRLDSPYPEEANRRIISSVASMHFAPTESARDNVLREYPNASVHVVGNTGIDTLCMLRSERAAGAPERQARRRVLVTMHRRESRAEHLASVCVAIRQLAHRCRDLSFQVPLHPNPEVREPAIRLLRDVPRVTLREPLSYRGMAAALEDSWLLLTDSGGLQEEAAFFGRPALVMRDCTDRPEAVAEGICRIVGTGAREIVREVLRLHDDPAHYARMCRPSTAYGDGHARGRIADLIERELFDADSGDAVPAQLKPHSDYVSRGVQPAAVHNEAAGAPLRLATHGTVFLPAALPA